MVWCGGAIHACAAHRISSLGVSSLRDVEVVNDFPANADDLCNLLETVRCALTLVGKDEDNVFYLGPKT